MRLRVFIIPQSGALPYKIFITEIGKVLGRETEHRVLIVLSAVATLVAQLFSCLDGKHCSIREGANRQLFCSRDLKVTS